MSAAPPIIGPPAKSKALRVLRRAFSFPVAIAALLAVLAVLTVRGRFDDPDMWWHLRDGQVVWTTHSVPTTDLYSYTTGHHQVVPQEWLSELLIYGAYRYGYSGLMLWLSFFSSLLLIVGYALCSFYSGNSKIAFLGGMIVWFFATVGLAVRGQVIGYLLLILELLFLYLGRSRNPRWLFALPLLMLLWVNCHASFFLGLIVLGVFVLCSFINFQAGSLVSARWEVNRRQTLIIASLLSLAAVFLNPVGWKQVFYPLDTMLRQPVNLANVQEWQALALSDPRGIGLAAVLLTVFLVLVVRRAEVLQLDELLLLAMAAWLALGHQRMAFVFGILAAPIVSRLLAPLWGGYDRRKDRIVPNAILIAAAILVAILAFPSRRFLIKQVDENSPANAVAYIKAHNLSGNMLNSYVDGGYLIWALPQHPVFVDGRADLYEWAGVLEQYGRWATLQEDPNALLDKYNIAFCLLQRGSASAHFMPLLPGWKQVYSDQRSVIFVRSNGAAGTN